MTSFALHVCCAPCLITAAETIRHDRQHPAPPIAKIFFYNPNIHPLLEFRRRLKALRVYLEREPLPAEIVEDYGLETYLAAILDANGRPPTDRRERCRRCYLLRLGWLAQRCKTEGLDAFSTTLLASREQDRDLVRSAAREIAEQYNLEFIDRDFRRFLPNEARLRGIYKQQYCACIFSEEERYRTTNKHLYRGQESADPTET